MDLLDILLEVMERDASDLHIGAGAPPMIRVNGELEDLEGYGKLAAADTRELVYSILSQDQRQRLENDWEIDLSYSVPGRARFRVNAFFQRNALSAAFRLIPVKIPQLDDLGLPRVLHEFTRKPRGFVVVTGPTGSGKSTTLAAMIDEINKTRREHIITIEDPIEFLHQHKKSHVNQREVGADTKGFNEALRSVLRQDPDIILIGEMRDTETMATALTAAETGHLVFATLHTQDASQTIDRIIDVFPPHQQSQIRVQLSTSLMGVCTQQLLPTRDGRGRCVACEISCPRRPSVTTSGTGAPTRSPRPSRWAATRTCRAWTRRSPSWSASARSPVSLRSPGAPARIRSRGCCHRRRRGGAATAALSTFARFPASAAARLPAGLLVQARFGAPSCRAAGLIVHPARASSLSSAAGLPEYARAHDHLARGQGVLHLSATACSSRAARRLGSRPAGRPAKPRRRTPWTPSTPVPRPPCGRSTTSS